MKEIELQKMSDVRQAINDELNALRVGKSSAGQTNATANLIGKFLETIKIDIFAHRYLAQISEGKGILNTPLKALSNPTEEEKAKEE